MGRIRHERKQSCKQVHAGPEVLVEAAVPSVLVASQQPAEIRKEIRGWNDKPATWESCQVSPQNPYKRISHRCA